MKIAVLGYDVEGSASYTYFRAQGHEVVIHDQDENKQVPEGAAAVLGPAYLDNLDDYDLLVRTPGMQPSRILDKNPGIADKVTSATNEFFKACPTRNIIGVTGTKGKGTTSSLITGILKAAGKKIFLGGNIGVPALSFLPEVGPDDWVVLELSSFQLIDCKYSPAIAACLMVVPEHLNWHKDMDEYLTAKSQLFAHQTPDDLAVYNADNVNSKQITSVSPAVKLSYGIEPISPADITGAFVKDDSVFVGDTPICTTDEIALLGRHNQENVCAAITATWDAVDHDREAIRQVVTTFKGLEHRLELVRTVDDVRYYDDSFGTTPETAIVAIQSFEEPKVVILGGADKGASFDELARIVADDSTNVKRVVLIGNTANTEHPTSAQKIKAALEAAGYEAITSLVKDGKVTMAEIVAAAHEAASPGDVVLLSAASASFDLFENYKERGKQFHQAVNAL